MLTQAQIEQYDRDGYLIVPDLFSPEEVALMQAEIRRLQVDSSYTVQQHDGLVRLFYNLHDPASRNPSPLFQRLARSPRLLGVAQAALRDEQLYMYHSKCNIKNAITGEIFQWHQDHGIWKFDGTPRADTLTAMVIAQEASELSGCLYFLPGSHKLGLQDPLPPGDSAAAKLRAVPPARIIEIMKDSPRPVAVTGKPGTCAFFNSNLLHASGHNLSMNSRWQLYFVYNPVANQPLPVPQPRAQHQCSRDFTPLRLGADSLAA